MRPQEEILLGDGISSPVVLKLKILDNGVY